MICSFRFLFGPRWRGALLAAGVGASAGLASWGALAQNIPAGSNLVTAGSAAPAAGTTWILGGPGIYMPSDITLPGGAGLAINGAGNTLTLNDGAGSFGRFLGSAGPYTLDLRDITLTGGNQPSTGGAFYVTGVSSMTLTGGGIAIAGNTASGHGGAIQVAAGIPLLIDADGTVELSGNTAAGSGYGGAIYASSDAEIHGSAIAISGNTAQVHGGGIYTLNGNITVGNADGSTDAVTISGNTNIASNGSGGAFFSSTSASTVPPYLAGKITITGQTVTISGNTAHSTGGALWSQHQGTDNGVTIDGGTITLDDNHSTGAYGGAVLARANVVIGNAASTVALTRNSAVSYGGAVMAFYGDTTASSITVQGGSITISNNSTTGAGSAGGALYTENDITVGGNSMVLTGNQSDFGGAICANGAGGVTLSGGPADISGNTATWTGGAIYANADVTLNATSGDFTFNGNQADGVASAIAFINAAGDATAKFNAASGRAITFYDPIASDPTVGLLTVTAPGPGAVVFDGANYTNPDDLWSEIYGTTTVQGGTFTVRHGAIYGLLAADAGESDPTSFTVASGATLAGGGTGDVRADHFTLGGTLDIAGAGSSASTFTIDSGNVSLGGSVRVKTYAGGQADVLAVNLDGGALTGQTSVNINPSGLGAPTSGNGILVVKVTNAAGPLAADAFSSPSVSKGAYAYDLVQVGNDWYLQSRLSPVPASSGTAAIPTLGEAALALLALLLIAGAVAMLHRRR